MEENKLQHDFISTISHELRTPLTSIRGFSQTMLASWDEIDDKSKKEFIKIIEEQSNRLIKLVENVLAVSKMQNSENYIFKNISVNSSIKSVIPIIAQQYKTHKITTVFNDKIPEILADKDKFQQVILNLTENACKYSPDNTTVKIITDFAENNYVSIKIIDNGVEIKKEDIERIFKKFARIDNPLTRGVQGSGLGLYITKSIVENLHGKINVSSNSKETVFEVLIPFADMENQARSKCLQQH